MVREEDVVAIARHCRNCLALASIELDRDYSYDDAPSSVTDAVFSAHASTPNATL